MTRDCTKRKKRPQRGFFKRGEIWWIDYADNSGRRIRESTKTSNKTEALKALSVRKAEVAQGKFSIEKSKPAPGFQKFAKVYLDEYAKVNKRSWVNDEIALRKHLIPFFGNRSLDRIAEIDVQRYKRSREEVIRSMPKNIGKAKPDITVVAINRELALLRKMFNQAIQWGKTQSNPITSNIRRYEEHERVRFLSFEEEIDLLNVCPPTLGNVVLFALNTGMRRSEISSLTWRNADPVNSTVTIKAGYSKNGETRRLALNETARSILSGLKGGSEDQGVIFTNSNGDPFLSSGIATAYKRAIKKSGIHDLTFQDLRHTFASRLAMGGVDLYTIQRLLGHKSQKMTLRYAHLSDGHLQNAVKTLDATPDFEVVRHTHGTTKEKRVTPIGITL